MTNDLQEVQGHDWDTAQDGWGVVYGVSRCKKCKAIATEQRLTEVCSLALETETADGKDRRVE